MIEMGTKIEMILMVVWLAFAMLYPIPSPTDGDGSANTLPHKAEILAALHALHH